MVMYILPPKACPWSRNSNSVAKDSSRNALDSLNNVIDSFNLAIHKETLQARDTNVLAARKTRCIFRPGGGTLFIDNFGLG